MIFIIRHDRHCRAKVLTKRLNELKIKNMTWQCRAGHSTDFFVRNIISYVQCPPYQDLSPLSFEMMMYVQAAAGPASVIVAVISENHTFSHWPIIPYDPNFSSKGILHSSAGQAHYLCSDGQFFSGKHCMKKHEKQNIPNFQIHQKLYGFSDSLSKLEPLQFKGMRF